MSLLDLHRLHDSLLEHAQGTALVSTEKKSVAEQPRNLVLFDTEIFSCPNYLDPNPRVQYEGSGLHP